LVVDESIKFGADVTNNEVGNDKHIRVVVERHHLASRHVVKG
jgi:hypothetical protein